MFEKLTETASTLMDAGELDIYSTLREVGCQQSVLQHAVSRLTQTRSKAARV